MNDGANRDVFELERITGLDISLSTALNSIADFQSFWGENIAFISVGVVQECDIGGAIGIVFNCRYHRWNPVAITFEIYDAQSPLVASAAVSASHVASVVAATRAANRRKQTLFRRFARQHLEVGDLHEPLTGSTRIELNNRHFAMLSNNQGRSNWPTICQASGRT